VLAGGAVACGLSVVGAVDSSPDAGDPDANPGRPNSGGDGAPTDEGDSGGGTDGAAPDATDAELLDAADEADAPPVVVPCPELGDGGATLDGHCYFALGQPRARDAAAAACVAANGAHLVTITSPEEQMTAASVGSGNRWIGLTSPMPTNDPTKYVWITGEALGPTFWSASQPNDMSPCVVMMDNDLWADRNCSNPSNAVCERA
jgi:hypothetical protein